MRLKVPFFVKIAQVGSFQPGWTVAPVAVHAPAIWFGGHVDGFPPPAIP